MKNRILFVDDDAKVLQALERMLYSLRTDWEMLFAGGAPEALTLLGQRSCDVIVSDMRMPEMDGAQLLAEVMHKHPQMIRIGLSGQSPQEMDLRAVGAAHQYLAKPCTSELLKATVMRMHRMRELLPNSRLQELVSRMKSLPSLPSLFLEIMEALQATTVSLDNISRIIEKDMGMTAKILQLANSAFFGARRRVEELPRAIALLGFDTIKSLVFSLQIFSQCDPMILGNLSLQTLWDHSFTTGAYARLIAQTENQEPQVADAAFTAGLLHDCGKLVLATNLPEPYNETLTLAQDEGLPSLEAERETFGVTHAEVGAYLLGIWGLPDIIVETVASHHDPIRKEQTPFGPLTAVHIAEVLMHEQRTKGSESAPKTTDLELLAKLGLSKRLPLWREQCLRYAQEGQTH